MHMQRSVGLRDKLLPLSLVELDRELRGLPHDALRVVQQALVEPPLPLAHARVVKHRAALLVLAGRRGVSVG